MVQEADVRTVRKKLAMSQEKLAEKLGVTRNTISRWELGAVRPSNENLIALNRLLAQHEAPSPDTGAEPVVSPAVEPPEPDFAPAAPPAEVPQVPTDEIPPLHRRNYRLWCALAKDVAVAGVGKLTITSSSTVKSLLGPYYGGNRYNLFYNAA